MRSRGIWIAAALGLSLIVPSWTSGAPRPTQSQIRTWLHGSWCWFGDPRAVHVVGQYDQTFVGWVNWDGGITVGSYDARFGVRRTVTIGHLYHDDHGSPAIFVEPDNRLTVFFSGHNGANMYYRTTLRPEDIRSWGPVQQVRSSLPGTMGFTYPNPQLLPDEGNILYLFWRGSQWGIDYATRTIDGRWRPARHLIAAPGQRPYLKTASNGSDTIALAFTNGHPRERLTSVFYAQYRHGALWHADGRRIAPLRRAPIAPQRADLIYNGGRSGASSWVWDTAFARDGRPVVVYATFADVHNHRYWYARFDGRRWVSHFMTFAGPTISRRTIEQQYSGGLALDHSDPSVVFLSRKVRGHFQIERWRTGDGGAHWQHTVVVRTSGADDVRPVVPRNADGGPMGLLWLQGHYGSYTTYRTSIAYLR